MHVGREVFLQARPGAIDRSVGWSLFSLKILRHGRLLRTSDTWHAT